MLSSITAMFYAVSFDSPIIIIIIGHSITCSTTGMGSIHSQIHTSYRPLKLGDMYHCNFGSKLLPVRAAAAYQSVIMLVPVASSPGHSQFFNVARKT